MIFGEAIQNYWRQSYISIGELEHTVAVHLNTGFENAPVMDIHDLELRLKECQEFLQEAYMDCGDDIQGADVNAIGEGIHHQSNRMAVL